MSTSFDDAAARLPSTDEEAWRYSPIGELDVAALLPVDVAPEARELPEVTGLPESAAARITVIDGYIVAHDVDPGWESKGLSISSDAAPSFDLPDATNGFDDLHTSLHRGGVEVRAAEGSEITDPVVIRYLHTGGNTASSNTVRVTAGADSSVTVLEHHASLGAGLSLPRTEFDVGARARLFHTVIQDLDDQSWQIGRVLARVGEQGLLSSGMAAFGGRYARVRTDVDLAGRSAKGELIGAYFADGDQVLDFRGFQHHSAPDTRTDMLFKGTVDDNAGSIYTGLINIHESGAGSNAEQTNRAVKLSDDAWAWSVPNLEIKNNDVRCAHASTVSPVDPDQRFYLHARGVPPAVADRLIVAGFFNEAIERLPVSSARAICAQKIADKLDERIQR